MDFYSLLSVFFLKYKPFPRVPLRCCKTLLTVAIFASVGFDICRLAIPNLPQIQYWYGVFANRLIFALSVGTLLPRSNCFFFEFASLCYFYGSVGCFASEILIFLDWYLKHVKNYPLRIIVAVVLTFFFFCPHGFFEGVVAMHPFVRC